MMTIKQTVEKLTLFLKKAGIETPELEASLILAHLLQKEPYWLHLNHNCSVDKNLENRAWEMARRRAQKEPLAYILGEKEFWSRPFKVTPDTLIPRPETELLIEIVLKLTKDLRSKPLKIADLGTGSGIIAITLAKELENVFVVGIDLSINALKIAKQNSIRHKTDQKILFIASNWLSAIKPASDEHGGLDFIVANPPYIPLAQAKMLEKDVLDFEPKQALFAGKKGTESLQTIIENAPTYLNKDGWLLCEIGWDQGKQVEQIAYNQNSYKNISIIQDYAGLDRIILAQKKG